MSVFHNNALIGASGQAAGGYTIERSIRLNSADSAYLSRTPASAGNRKTWTWAGWVKRSTLGGAGRARIFAAGLENTRETGIQFDGNDSLEFFNYTGSYGFRLLTTQVFRDPGAWYHIVIVMDTTQATASNRIKLYVNGVQITAFSTATYPNQNTDWQVNSTDAHWIGRGFYATSEYFPGYLADIHFIDGQALDPTSFGEFDDNGIWQPIEYSGSFGANGFHLDFADNSTAAALGYDAAGSNDWTVNNISVAAGAGNDSLVDVPTNGTETDTGVGGEVRGNYATWNPISKLSATPAPVNGNLTVNGGNASYAGSLLTTIEIPKTGKWYWEVTSDSSNWQNVIAGVADVPDPTYVSATNIGNQAAVYLYYAGLVTVRGSIVAAASPTYTLGTAGVTYGFAADMDNGDVYLYHNGTIQNSGNPIFTNLNSVTTPLFPATTVYNVEHHWNFGQRPFAYTAPSGFKALCTVNLPAPTIEDPSTVMDVALYTGTGSTQVISGLNMSPDFAWIKSRSNATAPIVLDIVRGGDRSLFTSAANLEAGTTGISSFNSDGFTLAADTTGYTNTNTYTYVAWTWDAGSSTVTNTDGSITSQVRANPSAGFSIVSYTGDGAASATIGHGLNVAPQMIMVKNRDVADEGAVYHVGVDATSPQNYFLKLFSTSNGTAARSDVGAMWNDTAPTSSVFSVGTEDNVNASTEDYIAYCFAPVAGYSSFGSYTGNGSTDGPFVYTGFRPRWIMLKNADAVWNWQLRDTSRDPINPAQQRLYPNTNDSETTNDPVDILSNGFKLRVSGGDYNASTQKYIYAAFAENPFALNARAR